MVVFTCQHCGDSVQKPKVEKHYNTKCRFKTPNLTCVDCLKDFVQQEYIGHNQCVSEEQRYAAKGTVIKEYAGRNKQMKYIEMIQGLLNSKDLTDTQRKLLEVCSKFDNVPRKFNKFSNFLKSTSKNIRCNIEDVKSVFKILEDSWKSIIPEQSIPKNKDILTKNVENEEHREPEDNMSMNDDSEPKKKKKKKDRSDTLIFDEEIVEKDNFTEYTKENLSLNVDEDNFKEDENMSMNDDSEPKKKKKKDRRDSLIADEEIVENDNFIEHTKENLNGISRKELKKQKKYEKYVKEMESVAKTEINGNIDNNESFDDNNKKQKKKSKKLKDHLNSDQQQLNGDANGESVQSMEIVPEESRFKKSKKRKMDSVECDTTEKKKKEIPEEEEVATFDWTDVIVRVLESRPDKELSLKRLSKKVINEYQIVKQDHRTYEELSAKFNKKIHKTQGVRVLKDRAKLIQ